MVEYSTQYPFHLYRQPITTFPVIIARALLLIACLCCLIRPTIAAIEDTEIEETLVIASRIEVPLKQIGSSVSVIDSDDIELLGYTSMADILRSQIGIATSNSGGIGKQTALRIRGEESYRTQIFLDGIKLSDPTATQVAPIVGDLLSSHIARVEIIRGPQGLIYGADAGGVIYMRSPRAESELESGLTLEYGSYENVKLAAYMNGKSDRYDFAINALTFNTDGFNARSDDPSEDEDGYSNTSLHGVFGYNPSEESRIQLVFRSLNAENQFDRCAFPTVDNCENQNQSRFFRLSGTTEWGLARHNLAYNQTAINRTSGVVGKTSFQTEGSIERLDYSGQADLKELGALVYAIEYEEEDVTTNTGEQLQRSQFSYYLEYQGNVGKTYFTAGLRSDEQEQFGQHTSFRIGAARLFDYPNWSLKLKASSGSGFRAPSISELSYNAGPFAFGEAATIQLKEETSFGYDFGVQLNTQTGYQFEVVFFDQSIQDELFFDLIEFSGYLQASGESKSQGIEMVADMPVTDRIKLGGNLTYNKTEQQDTSPRIRRPRLIANFSVDVRLSPKLNFSTFLRLSQGSEDSIFGTGTLALEDYELISINLSYRFNPSIKMYCRVENLADAQYQEITNFNTSGRALYLGIQGHF